MHLLKTLGILFILTGIILIMAYYALKVQVMPWKKIIVCSTAYVISWIFLVVLLFFILRGE
jgi:hypothetical protein